MVTPTQNNGVREFVARHTHPYDPETDDYDRPPFASDIKEGKNDPIYNAHSYHTKVPPRSIIPYILHYTEPGDLILDPFCGTGMSGVAALMCADPPPDILDQFPELKERVGQRRAVLNDLSPAACHIAHNYTTPVDLDALRHDFERIKTLAGDEFSWLYGTEHYEPAVGDHDPRRGDVARRIRDHSGKDADRMLFDNVVDRTWQLITRGEVERRLGYPVQDLPRGRTWADLDVGSIDQWVAMPAMILYTIWSDVYRCEGLVTVIEPTGKISTRGKNAGKPMIRKRRVSRGCGGEIVLWDVAVDQQTGGVRDVFSCPHCSVDWSKGQIPRIRSVPVVVSYQVRSGDGGRVGQRAPGRRVTRMELDRLSEIEMAGQPYWVPDTPMDPQGPQYRRNALRVRRIAKVTDFWTSRNLRAYAWLWAEAEGAPSPRTTELIRFILTAITPFVTRKQAWGTGGGGLSGQLYLSSFQLEKNVLDVMSRKAEQLLGRLSTTNWLSHDCVLTQVGTATQLEIPSDSIDYIFTDPPFGSNIYYSEPNLLWEAWLGRTTDTSEEAVVHRKNDGGTKRLSDYARLMSRAIAEMYRVLKPGRWATIEFNNSDGEVFETIKESIRSAGFEVANMLLLDKTQKTFKQVKGASGDEDVVDKDVIINLRKPAHGAAAVAPAEHDLERRVFEVVREHLQTLPDRMRAEPEKYNDDYRTTATLNSVVMNALLPEGVSLERLNLRFIERVCNRYFRKVGQHWYLRGEAVGVATDGGLFQAEVQVDDEATAIGWIRQRLHRGPALLGELRPHWMRATGLLPQSVAATLVLEELLLDNFWRDPDTNRWREPTEEERERMSDDRALRVLHDAERFVEGSLKRQASEQERAGWIDTLYRTVADGESTNEAAALPHRRMEPDAVYSVIVRLFHDLPPDRLDAKVFSRAKKQAEVASRQLKKLVIPGGAKATTATATNLPLFRGEGDDSE